MVLRKILTKKKIRGGAFDNNNNNNNEDTCDPDKYLSADKKGKLKMKSKCISYCEDKETACGGFDDQLNVIEMEPICKELKVCLKTMSITEIIPEAQKYGEMLLAIFKQLNPGKALSELLPKPNKVDTVDFEKKKKRLVEIEKEVSEIIKNEPQCKSVIKDFENAKSLYNTYIKCLENTGPGAKNPQVVVCLLKIKDKLKEYYAIKDKIFKNKMETGIKGSLKRMKSIASNYKKSEKKAFSKITRQRKTKKTCKKEADKEEAEKLKKMRAANNKNADLNSGFF